MDVYRYIHMNKILFVFFLLGLVSFMPSVSLEGQSYTMSAEEKELNLLFGRMQKAPDDQTKRQINDTIVMKFGEILSRPESFGIKFDSLRYCGKVVSSDGVVRIFTWNMVLSDLRHQYFGFLQVNKPGREGRKTYFLKDSEDLEKDAERKVYTPEHWYGCLIYKILYNRYRGEEIYTLLALDYNNLLSNKKIIDVLWFDEDNKPVFGKPVFQDEKGKLTNRVIFEYNAQAVMGLKWNERLQMIVYDHLSPVKPEFEGNYKFYGPDFSFDAYRFDKGIWVYVPDVNVLND